MTREEQDRLVGKVVAVCREYGMTARVSMTMVVLDGISVPMLHRLHVEAGVELTPDDDGGHAAYWIEEGPYPTGQPTPLVVTAPHGATAVAEYRRRRDRGTL